MTLSIEEYQIAANRTAATPSAEPSVMYANHMELVKDLLTHIVYCQQADLSKRSLFYRSSHEKLRERTSELLVGNDKLMDNINKFTEENPEKVMSEEQLNVVHAALGLMSEAGEILEEVVKSFVEQREMDKVNLGEEGGDGMWYLALLFTTLKTNFIVQGWKNIKKLLVRYKDKFSEDDAVNRNLVEERKILEDNA